MLFQNLQDPIAVWAKSVLKRKGTTQFEKIFPDDELVQKECGVMTVNWRSQNKDYLS